MKNLTYLIFKTRKSFFILIAMTFLSLVTSFSIPWLNKVLIDEILVANRFELITIVMFIYIFLALINVGLSVLIPRLSTLINEKIILDLRMNLTRSIQTDQIKLLNSSEKGDLLNVYNQDIPIIASLITVTVKNFIEHGITLLITIIILLNLDFRMALLAMVRMPLYLFLPILFKEKIKKTTTDVQEKMQKLMPLYKKL